MSKITATGCETEQTTQAGDIARLEESFQVFTRMTRDLESAYNKLSGRAARIDLELVRTNKELRHRVHELNDLTLEKSAILDALPGGVVVIDGTGCITFVNRAAAVALGQPSAELVGRSRAALVGPTGDYLLAQPGTPGGGASSGPCAEKDITTLDGSRRRISITVEPLPQGSELQVINDHTVVTRLREQLGRLDTLASLGEMAAGVAHEIRNPLNGIDGFAGLLERALKSGKNVDSTLRYASNIRQGVREVDAIITNLLTFAAPGACRFTTLSIASILEGIVETSQSFVGDQPAREISLTIHPDLRRVPVQGDSVKLKIVWTNLVKNAIEAARSRVDISAAPSDDATHYEVAIRDDGPGLSDEIRQRLFTPFSTTKAEGTGLGLAIAHKFTTLHGGEIDVSDSNRGSTFTVKLPVQPEENNA